MIELRDYQKDIANQGVEILTKYHLLYLALQVRVGKTLTALAIAEKMGYKNVLFLTKKKAIASIENDYKELSPDYKLTVTNYEQAEKFLPDHKLIDLVIVDEAQNFGAFAKPSKRTLTVKKICAFKDVIMMSGTPSPESYSQLYHQLSLSSWSPLSQYSNFYKFAKDFVTVKLKYLNGYTINDYSNCDGNKLWQVIKHIFIQFSQEEAGFKAPVDEFILDVEMTKESKVIYRELEKHKIHKRRTPGNGFEVVATVNSGGDLINKLCQVSSGTLIFDDQPKGTVIDVSKAHFVWNYFFGKKIAIFYKYRSEFDILIKYFPDYTESPEEFNCKDYITFLGQVQSSREGTNLSTADALVMYNIDFSATSYFQARARIQSLERKGSSPLYWIFSTHGIERKVYQAVSNKKNFTHSYYIKDARKTHTVPLKEEAGSVGVIGS